MHREERDIMSSIAQATSHLDGIDDVSTKDESVDADQDPQATVRTVTGTGAIRNRDTCVIHHVRSYAGCLRSTRFHGLKVVHRSWPCAPPHPPFPEHPV